MKTVRLFSFLFFSFFIISCASVGLQGRIKQLTPGMPKAEVVKTLGKGYEVVHSMLTPEGDTIEVYKYIDTFGTDMYEVEFFNNILVRYTKLQERPEHKHDHGHHHK